MVSEILVYDDAISWLIIVWGDWELTWLNAVITSLLDYYTAEY